MELTKEQQAACDRIARILGEQEAVQMKLRKAVADARAAGVEWAEIGQALGVTKQAAHQRFGGE